MRIEDVQARLAFQRLAQLDLAGDSPIRYQGCPAAVRFLGWVPILRQTLDTVRGAISNRTGLVDSIRAVRRHRGDIDMFQASRLGPSLRTILRDPVEPAPEPR